MGGTRQTEIGRDASVHDRLTKDKEKDIIRKIHSLQKRVLPGKSGGSKRPGTVSDAVIFQYQKKLIMDFADDNGIYIAPEFWNLGNLRRVVIGGGTVDCEGTEEEIERYDEIMSLCREIEEFNRRGNSL